jgi:hypothetical protein
LQRLFASLVISAARGIERALIIERLRARLGQRLAQVGALDTASGLIHQLPKSCGCGGA